MCGDWGCQRLFYVMSCHACGPTCRSPSVCWVSFVSECNMNHAQFPYRFGSETQQCDSMRVMCGNLRWIANSLIVQKTKIPNIILNKCKWWHTQHRLSSFPPITIRPKNCINFWGTIKRQGSNKRVYIYMTSKNSQLPWGNSKSSSTNVY